MSDQQHWANNPLKYDDKDADRERQKLMQGHPQGHPQGPPHGHPHPQGVMMAQPAPQGAMMPPQGYPQAQPYAPYGAQQYPYGAQPYQIQITMDPNGQGMYQPQPAYPYMPPPAMPQGFQPPAELPPGYTSMEQYRREWMASLNMQKVWRGKMVRRQISKEHGDEVKFNMKSGKSAGKRRPKVAVDKSAGTVIVKVHTGKNLYDTQCCLKQDPFVKVTVKSNVATGPVCYSGGIKPRWDDEPVIALSINPQLRPEDRKEVDRAAVDVLNKNVLMDDIIGSVNINFEDLWKAAATGTPAKKKAYQLKRERGSEKAGELFLTASYLPPVTILLKEMTDLIDVQTIGKQDPFVRFEYKGKLPTGDTGIAESKICRDGHTNPKWNQQLSFNVMDERHFDEKQCTTMEDIVLTAQVINANHMVNDNIAYAEIPFSKLHAAKIARKSGKVSKDTPLSFKLYAGKLEDKGAKPAGSVTVLLL